MQLYVCRILDVGIRLSFFWSIQILFFSLNSFEPKIFRYFGYLQKKLKVVHFSDICRLIIAGKDMKASIDDSLGSSQETSNTQVSLSFSLSLPLSLYVCVCVYQLVGPLMLLRILLLSMFISKLGLKIIWHSFSQELIRYSLLLYIFHHSKYILIYLASHHRKYQYSLIKLIMMMVSRTQMKQEGFLRQPKRQ